LLSQFLFNSPNRPHFYLTLSSHPHKISDFIVVVVVIIIIVIIVIVAEVAVVVVVVVVVEMMLHQCVSRL